MRDHEGLDRALTTLGQVLVDRQLRFHIAIAGGSALLMSGEGSRPTGDVDVVAVAEDDEPLVVRWALPSSLVEAAQDVARTLDLPTDWLNAGAVGILETKLPEGFTTRLRSRVYDNLVVSALGRMDLLRLKVLAAVDEGRHSQHVADVRAMRPTRDELADAFGWVTGRMPAGTPGMDEVASALGVEVDYGS